MKKKIIFVFALLALPINVLGFSYRGCEFSVISRLKSIVSNINISYDYHITNSVVSFDVTINNLTPDIYFYDSSTEKTYYYNDTNNGEITIKNYSGKEQNKFYKFFAVPGACYGKHLGTKYYSFPTYNQYYNSKICSGIPEFKLCQKWVSVNYTYDEFKKKVEEYKKDEPNNQESEIKVVYEKNLFDKIIYFYVNYYYYLLIGMIAICCIVIIIKRKKDRFKL